MRSHRPPRGVLDLFWVTISFSGALHSFAGSLPTPNKNVRIGADADQSRRRYFRERTICPHALVKASGRWHVRAFDFARKSFIDFALSRVLSSSSLPSQAPLPAELDDNWHRHVTIEFVPHPALSQAQKAAVCREYGMVDGYLKMDVRRAILFYLLDETRLLSAVRQSDETLGKGLALWVRNVRKLSAELASMEIEN